ncbi:hypothetical protein PENTCL1PPCAC_23968 [Pristionchus entomophagus]|uniref:Uncharacterized protein n=1 Tax=Pristionchus entomophagus TaxID=358040 RepID=A0AAV5U6Q3_9BILA|nr:hypothetical protein PENTCL1PPCAC_23968 [Pristionchus entomophagus]
MRLVLSGSLLLLLLWGGQVSGDFTLKSRLYCLTGDKLTLMTNYHVVGKSTTDEAFKEVLVDVGVNGFANKALSGNVYDSVNWNVSNFPDCEDKKKQCPQH